MNMLDEDHIDIPSMIIILYQSHLKIYVPTFLESSGSSFMQTSSIFNPISFCTLFETVM